MADIRWLNDIDGDFATAADWSGGSVPGAADDAILHAAGSPFTVTSSANESVNGVDLAAHAALDITGGTFTAGNGVSRSTIANSGRLESDGGLLWINNAYVRGHGGVIVASEGTIKLSTCDVTGQALELDAGGVVQIAGGRFTTAGAIENAGTLALAGHLRLDGNATLSGGGEVLLTGVGLISASRPGVVLTNVDNTIQSRTNTELGNDKTTLVNEAGAAIYAAHYQLAIDAGTVINAGVIGTTTTNEDKVITGQMIIRGAIDNTGEIVEGGARLTVTGAVTGSGSVVIQAGTLDFKSTFDQDVAFTNGEIAGAVLSLRHSQSYAAAISGFSTFGRATLDLHDIGFVGASEASFSGTSASGVLTVTDGTHSAHITLNGDYLGATFVASGDGAGGTDVIATSGAASAPPHRLIAAMAGLGGSAGEAIHPGQAWTAREAALARPHATA